MIIDFGKVNKGKELSECDEKYLKWLVSHEKVLAKRNRWAARDAKIILERRAQIAAQAAAYAEAVAKFEDEREARLAIKAAEQIVRANQGANRGNLYNNRGFQLMR